MTHSLGRVPDPPDARDHSLARYMAMPVLPPYHRAPHYPVLDQGQTPQCVAFSGALTRTIAERTDEKRTLIFDAPELYADAKAIDGSPGDGTYIRAACKVLASDGALVSGSPVGGEIGKLRKIAGYARLLSIDEIKAAILSGGSAWLGSTWYDSWFAPVAGVLPKPDTVADGHAYTAIGWSDSRKALRCQNSWGISWGQSGRFWLPYAYVDFADFDCWKTVDVVGDV